MPRKRFSSEEIVVKLHEADVVLAQGRPVTEVCKRLMPVTSLRSLYPQSQKSIPCAGTQITTVSTRRPGSILAPRTAISTKG